VPPTVAVFQFPIWRPSWKRAGLFWSCWFSRLWSPWYPLPTPARPTRPGCRVSGTTRNYDDVVLLVTSEIGFVEAAVDREIDCLLSVFGRVRSFTSGILSVCSLLPDCPRAPPTAW